MTNLKDKATNVIMVVKRKALPVALSASTAISALTVNAFAEEAGTTVDYSGLTTTITSAFSQIVTNCVNIAVAIIPIGIGLIAIGKMWDVAKRFFNKATK